MQQALGSEKGRHRCLKNRGQGKSLTVKINTILVILNSGEDIDNQ
jgi:hypothetical protein